MGQVSQVCSRNYVLKFIQVLFSLYKFCSEVYTGSEILLCSVLKWNQF
jgi:hypothetical protein